MSETNDNSAAPYFPHNPSATRSTDVRKLTQQEDEGVRFVMIRKYYQLLVRQITLQAHVTPEEAHDVVMELMLSEGLSQKTQGFIQSNSKTPFRWFLVKQARDWLSNRFRREKRRQGLLQSNLQLILERASDTASDPQEGFKRKQTMEHVRLLKHEYESRGKSWEFRAWERFSLGHVTLSELLRERPEQTRHKLSKVFREINQQLQSMV